MSPHSICYLGDDHLGAAAGYLGAVMGHFGMAYDHLPSTESPRQGFRQTRYRLYVVSDYPRARFSTEDMEAIVRSVEQGSGLLMLGGWESFHGRLGEYDETPLAKALPVVISSDDDRRNCAQTCLVRPLVEHPVLAGLPWQSPPSIGGFNALAPKPGSELLLAAVPFRVRWAEGRFDFVADAEMPLLVVGRHGQGRTAALATDAAPHWVGGLVDWGQRRVEHEVAGSRVEVGDCYARFFRNLLSWTGGQDAALPNDLPC